MITFLQGVLVEKQPMRVVLDVGGVGYEVFIPLSSYDRLPPPQTSCRLLTYDHVREDQHALYGFQTQAERRMFLLLMEVSGIGPKVALGVLSGLSVRELVGAIGSGETKRLSSVSGIGKKRAERIVLELRDKLDEADVLEAAGTGGAPEDPRLHDAVLALLSLGYHQAEARQAVKKALESGPAPASVEDLVRKALAHA